MRTKLKIGLTALVIAFSSVVFAQKDDKKDQRKKVELKQYNPKKKTKKDANYSVEIVEPSSGESSGNTSSSSFSFSSKNGGSKAARYAVEEFYNKEVSERREKFQKELVEVAKKEGAIKKDEKEVKIEVNEKYVKINGRQVSAELTKKIQEKLTYTLEHGDKYSYVYVVTLDEK